MKIKFTSFIILPEESAKLAAREKFFRGSRNRGSRNRVRSDGQEWKTS